MSKFATAARKPAVASPVTAGATASTHEGGKGYAYDDPRSALFLLACSNMVSEETYYESARERDSRFRDLVHQVTREDPDWLRRFVPFLRERMLMRSASVVAACEYLKAGGPGAAALIDSALQRADEPAEALAYWMGAYGRRLPMALKRGVAKAITRLFTERAAVRYDGHGRAWRMGDVIELVHPRPKSGEQSALFKHLLDQRHHGDGELRIEGTTWERANPTTAEEWEAVIPEMGYMALLRNLRNFDERGVSDAVAAQVAAKLADPEQVAQSRQLPIRFLSAWTNTHSMRWGPALERALDASLSNVPALTGRTLILIDTSASMGGPLSARSTVTRAQAAIVFGLALAKRCESVDVVSYSTDTAAFAFKPGESVLRAAERFPCFWGSTYTWAAVRRHLDRHDRVVLLTDEQAHDDDPGTPVPIYTFNLAGYSVGHAEAGTPNRYTFGGLSDAAFLLLPMLEARRDGHWPF